MVEDRSKQAGFTLVEVLMWIALSAIIMAAISPLLSTLTKVWVYGNHQYDVQQTASLVTNIMTNDLRYGKNYQVLSDYSNAQADEAISYTSLRDNLTVYIYYVDKTNRHLYRIPGYKSNAAELVPGQNGTNFAKITIAKPSTTEKIFSSDGSSIDIALKITDTSVASQTPLVVYTTVTGLKSSFVK